MSSRNLFEIDAELTQVAAALEAMEEVKPEDRELQDAELTAVVEKYFGDLTDERDRKLDNYAKFIRAKEGAAKIRKAEADRLSALARADENQAKRARSLLHAWLESKGLGRIETTYNKFAIQKSGGVAPLVYAPDADPRTVEGAYQVIEYSFNHDVVRTALKAGAVLPWARFGEVGTHLRIR